MAQMPNRLSGVRGLILPWIKHELNEYGVECDIAISFVADNIQLGFWLRDKTAYRTLTRKNIDDNAVGPTVRTMIEDVLVELGVKPRPGAFDGADEYEEILSSQAVMDELTGK